jgi:D-glycero-alpha-D-manno-heptose-7-phosphate kinase
MIISQTPFRISFFGGGTDYPEYFSKESGAVLGTAIDKFAYLSATHLYSRLFDYTIRLAYRKVECVNELEAIEHAPFRECLRAAGITRSIEVDYTAELPSSVGLGTSSTFVVGTLNVLNAFAGRVVHPLELAYQAIRIEREMLHESVGCQDQTFAAMGGFNLIEFRAVDDVVVHRLPLNGSLLQEFDAHLLLLYTGIRRRASQVAARQVQKIGRNVQRLRQMRAIVDEGYQVLAGRGNLAAFGELLHKSWTLKSQLDESVSSGYINEIYRTGLEHGALGGKLLGAGGGGFVLFFVPPEKRAEVRRALSALEEVPVRVNSPGTRIIHAESGGYYETEPQPADGGDRQQAA